MPGMGVFHTLILWVTGSGVRLARTLFPVRTDPSWIDPRAPYRFPAQVIAGLTPGHLRVDVGGFHIEIPLDQVPFACRMPNTPLWITISENEVIAVEPRVT